MVETGRTAVVHVVARTVQDGEPGAVVETTDVDVALEAGTYDAHRDYQPMEFRVGAGEVPPAVEETVREMDPGDERTVVADPEEAFGRRREDRVVEMDRRTLEERSETEAEAGALVTADTGATGWITDVGERAVTVDFNHEFAGERVAFEVRVLDVREPEATGAHDDG